MQIFGITLNRYSIPVIYLACAIVGFLLIRESIHMFQHPIATRAISVWLGIGFIALSIPAIHTNTNPLPRQASVLLIIWLAWTLLSTLLGEQPWPAMVRWFEIFTSILIALCLYFIIRQQPKLITLLAKSIVTAVLLCLIALIVFWNVSPDPVKHNWVNTLPFFINIRHLGYLAAISIPVGHWLLDRYSRHNHGVFQNNPVQLAYVVGYLILCWALVFWLGGRGTFLAVTITSFLYIFFAPKQNIKWVIISPLIGVLVSQFFLVDHPSLNLFRFIGEEGITLNAFTSFREVIYQESLIYWWENAPLTGIGADGYRYLIPAIGNVESIAHPHSSIIQLLLSYGPIGLLIPTYFFFILTWRVATNDSGLQSRTDQHAKNFYLILLATLILSLFDGILYHAYGLFISSIIAGTCIALTWPLKSEKLTAHTSSNTSANHSRVWINTLVAVGVLFTAAYYAVFTHQLYHSKYGVKSEKWINWNAEYPLYFSPTWTYQRYKAENIEQLKQDYIKRLNSK